MKAFTVVGIVGLASIGAIAVAISPGQASGGDAPPTTAWPPAAHVASPSPARSAAEASALSILPTGSKILGTKAVVEGRANYLDVTARAGNVDFDVTYYAYFAASELTGAGLPEASLAQGTAWVGSDTAPFRSVYFLGRSGHGVYISSAAATPGQAVSSLQVLEADAIRLSNAPSAAFGGK